MVRKSLWIAGALSLGFLSMGFILNTGGRGVADSSALILHTDEYIVDTVLSKLEWTGKKATGQHTGTVQIARGSLYNNHGTFTGGEFEINMRSIRNTDLKEGMRNKLESHLKSADFFNVDSFPIASFSISKVTVYNGPEEFSHSVTGNLTIKGITHEIAFPAKIVTMEGQITADAYFDIDRSKWNVRYGSKSFINDIGDKAISDMINFRINLVAKRAH